MRRTSACKHAHDDNASILMVSRYNIAGIGHKSKYEAKNLLRTLNTCSKSYMNTSRHFSFKQKCEPAVSTRRKEEKKSC